MVLKILKEEFSPQRPIHRKPLNADSISLRLADRSGCWISEIENSPGSDPPLDAASHDGISAQQENMKAIAPLIYFMLTWERKEGEFQMTDFLDSPEIEINMLILALQKGLTPEEALFTPLFQDDLVKKTSWKT